MASNVICNVSFVTLPIFLINRHRHTNQVQQLIQNKLQFDEVLKFDIK